MIGPYFFQVLRCRLKRNQTGMDESESKPKKMGGARPGAGRKSKWRSPSKMVRIPKKYEAEILEYAKLLDTDAEFTLTVHDDQVEEDADPEERSIEAIATEFLMTVPQKSRAEAKKWINKFTTWMGANSHA